MIKMPKLKINFFFQLLFWAILGINFIRLLHFSWEHRNLPWPHGMLAIDGHSYLKGAQTILVSLNPFNLPNIYHSPGYQFFLGLLGLMTGSTEELIIAYKVFSLLMWALTLLMLFSIGSRFFSKSIASMAVLLLSSSLSWMYYVNMIQYEVLVGFLLCCYFYFLSSSFHTIVLRSFILVFLAWIQVRYLVLIFIPLHSFLKENKIWPREKWVFLMASLITFSTVLIQSSALGKLTFFQEGGSFRFLVSNNPNARGWSFPYPQIIEPSGWKFLWEQPSEWAWLVYQRLLFQTGIKGDLWKIPPSNEPILGEISFLHILGVVLFGLGVLLWRERNKTSPLLMTIILIQLPCLLFFGSFRFIIPLIPLIVLFQSVSIVYLWTSLFSKKLNRRI